MHLKRTNSEDSDFQSLVRLLDEELLIRDGKEHVFYAQFNTIGGLKNVVVYYEDAIPVGCGAFKKFDDKSVEIKRMFVRPECRSKGIGAKILNELERWAAEINYSETVLETGKKQPEAIRLYQKEGYVIIPNFGQYKDVINSVCMKKVLTL